MAITDTITEQLLALLEDASASQVESVKVITDSLLQVQTALTKLMCEAADALQRDENPHRVATLLRQGAILTDRSTDTIRFVLDAPTD